MMQLLLVRHALPLVGTAEDGADPPLSEHGFLMADRVAKALDRFQIGRIVSSPQRRAQQSAQPVATALGLPVETEERFAEYDYGLTEYVPVEELRATNPEKLARLVRGELPDGVNVDAFKARVTAAAGDLVAEAQRSDTVVVFSHGGAINVILQQALRTPTLFPFRLDYVSVSHLKCSPNAETVVMGVNNIEHVWDMLPRLTGR
jgi:probable phosphoglycerate mutase